MWSVTWQGVLQGLWAGFLVESKSWLVVSVASCWGPHAVCYESLLFFPVPIYPQTIHPCKSPQCSRWGKTEMGFLGTIPQSWRSLMHFSLLTFPCGRNCRPNGSSMALSYLTVRGDMDKVELCIFFQSFLFHRDAGTSQPNSLLSIKVFSSTDAD